MLLEIIEIANQASQVISFGSERDFDWVIGVCFLLLLNSLFVPIPWLIAQYTNSQRTSKVVAAIGDLVFDTFFLLLNQLIIIAVPIVEEVEATVVHIIAVEIEPTVDIVQEVLVHWDLHVNQGV